MDNGGRFPNNNLVEVRYPASAGPADGDLFFPCCFRDASEIRRITDGEER